MNFYKNLSLLKPYLGQNLFRVLSEITEAELHAYEVESGFNYKFQQIGLYEPTVDSFCEQQIDVGLQKNWSVDFADGLSIDDSLDADFASVIASNMLKLAPKYNLALTGKAEFKRRGHFVSFGLGIGTHISKILKKQKFKSVIIAEPNFDFLIAHLVQNDWQDIVQIISEQQGELHIVVNDDPNLLSSTIISLMKDRCFELIEGSLFLQHYQSEILDRTIFEFDKSRHQVISYNGWLEDELLHLENHLTNTLNKDVSILKDSCAVQNMRVARGKACIVVGSGPSLDNTLSVLKKLSEKVTIFSCGTSLQPLLAAGIYPDFHVELENSQTVYDILEKVIGSYDLSRIHLLCPTNSVTNLDRFFKSRLSFIRETNGFLKAFSYGSHQVSGTAPSPVNTAVRFASIFGFQYCFFWGADFSYSDKKHHAQNSIYMSESGMDDLNLGKGSGNNNSHFAVAGNFSDQVVTNSSWTFMRNALEFSISQEKNIEFLNCSDGANIHGAHPVDPIKLLNLSFPDKTSDLQSRIISLFETEYISQESQATGLEKLLGICNTAIQSLNQDIAELLTFPEEEIDEELVDKYFSKYYTSNTHQESSYKSSFDAAFGISLIKIFHIMRYIALRNGNTNTSWFQLIQVLNNFLPYIRHKSLNNLQRVLSAYNIGQKPDDEAFLEGCGYFKAEDAHQINDLLKEDAIEAVLEYMDLLDEKYFATAYTHVIIKIGLLFSYKNRNDVINYIDDFPLIFPQNIFPYRAAIAAAKMREDLALGKHAFQKANIFFPDQELLHMLHSDLHACCGATSQAISLAKDMTEKEKQNLGAGKIAQALALNAADETEKAQTLFSKLGPLPKTKKIFLYDKLYIDMSLRSGAIEQAKKICQDAIQYYENNGDRHDQHYFRLRYLIICENFTDAIELYKALNSEHIRLLEIENLFIEFLLDKSDLTSQNL